MVTIQATNGNAGRGQLGLKWELPVWGLGGALLCPSFLLHCQETLIKKSSKDWEHMFIL